MKKNKLVSVLSVLSISFIAILAIPFTSGGAGAQGLTDKETRQVIEQFFGTEMVIPDAKIRDSDLKRSKRALPWIRKAAEQGDAHALFLLGKELLNGFIVKKNEAEALTLMGRAAEAGSVAAAIELAFSTYLFDDEKDEFTWAEKAAEAGDAYFQKQVGNYFHVGTFSMPMTIKPSELLIDTMGNRKKADPAKAARWYRRAAGNAAKGAALGYLWLTDDMERAVQLELEAHVFSYFSDYSVSDFRLGLLKDETVQAWIRKQAPKGNPTARLAWGVLAAFEQKGWGSDAGRWLSGPGSAGNPLAPVLMAIYERKYDVDGLRRAVAAGNPTAHFLMWNRHRYDRHLGGGMPSAKGLPWLEKAVNMGVPKAWFDMGEVFRDGKLVAGNTKLAIRWLKKAADRKMCQLTSDARLRLSTLYLEAGDRPRAVTWLYEAGADEDLDRLLDRIGK